MQCIRMTTRGVIVSNALIHVQPLLAALSAVLGQSIDLDGQGTCTLEFDGDVEIVIALTPDSRFMTVQASLMYPGQAPTAQTLHDALAFNCAHLPPGSAIALDEASEQLVLMAVHGAESLTQESFLEQLSDFVALVPELRSRLAAQPGMATMDGAMHALSDSWN